MIGRWYLVLSLLVIFLSIFVIHAQEKTNIAVIDLGSRGGLSQGEIGTLTDRLRSLLVRTNTFNVVDRGKMEEILAEQGFQMSGCTSTECIVEAGQILGVEEMITGSIGKIGRLYTIDIILIDVSTSQIIKSITRDYQGEVEGLVDLMKSIANELGGIQKRSSVPIPETGSLEISAQPTTVEVYLDNRQVGKTPLKLDNLELGKYQIKLQTPGYAPYEEEIVIEKGKRKTVSVKLKKIFTLSITSTPAEADVFVNNKNIGKTPFNSSGIEGTKLIIQVKKENYKIWQESIVLNKDIHLSQKLEMTEEYKKSLAEQIKMKEKEKEQETAQPSVKKTSGNKIWWWVGGGAVVVATAAYFLVSGSDQEETKDFPAPPGRP